LHSKHVCCMVGASCVVISIHDFLCILDDVVAVFVRDLLIVSSIIR